jgi:hypothetical protein
MAARCCPARPCTASMTLPRPRPPAARSGPPHLPPFWSSRPACLAPRATRPRGPAPQHPSRAPAACWQRAPAPPRRPSRHCGARGRCRARAAPVPEHARARLTPGRAGFFPCIETPGAARPWQLKVSLNPLVPSAPPCSAPPRPAPRAPRPAPRAPRPAPRPLRPRAAAAAAEPGPQPGRRAAAARRRGRARARRGAHGRAALPRPCVPRCPAPLKYVRRRRPPEARAAPRNFHSTASSA